MPYTVQTRLKILSEDRERVVLEVNQEERDVSTDKTIELQESFSNFQRNITNLKILEDFIKSISKEELSNKILFIKGAVDEEMGPTYNLIRDFYNRNALDPAFIIFREDIDFELLDLSDLSEMKKEIINAEKKLIEEKDKNKITRFEIMDI